MKNPERWAALCTLALAGFAAVRSHAAPINVWMTQEAMRGAFIGKTLDGHYVDGLRWTETYSTEGRLDYRESVRKGLGYWYFRGNVFCTFYDPGYGLNDGRTEDDAALGPLGNWAARAWREGEPSTCEDRPSV